MMKTIFTLFIALSTLSISASNYKEAMRSTLAMLDSAQSILDHQTVANQFERIALQEPSNWIPVYYQAQTYIIMSFFQQEDVVTKDRYLDQAQTCINKMLEINDQESEIHCLQSLLYTARLVVDPMNRGQNMMMMSGKSIARALELNPNNPRANYVLLSNEVGQAQFFGKDPTAYCERIIHLNKNWPEANATIAFYPNWGREEAKSLLGNCK